MRTAKGHSKLDFYYFKPVPTSFQRVRLLIMGKPLPTFSVYVHAWLQGGKPDLWAFGFLKGFFASCFFS
jgi:hypothetical protein